MKTGRRIPLVMIVLLPLGLAVMCPQPRPFPPPRLNAPDITSLRVDGIRTQGTWNEVVAVSWQPPPGDSVGIGSYTLLRQVAGDTGFSIAVIDIPDTVTTVYDRIDNTINFPVSKGPDREKAVHYRLYGVDTLGRAGDTSATDTILLWWQPALGFPVNDTLGDSTSLHWSVSLIQGGFFAWPRLWSETALLWGPPASIEPAFTGEGTVTMSRTLPDSILPLDSGTYYFGIVVNILHDKPAYSMSIGRFHVQ